MNVFYHHQHAFQMTAPNNNNHSKLQEDAIKLREVYLKASSWIRDMSAPRAPARLRPNRGPHAAAGAGHYK